MCQRTGPNLLRFAHYQTGSFAESSGLLYSFCKLFLKEPDSNLQSEETGKISLIKFYMEGFLYSSDLIFKSEASLQGTSLSAMCLAQKYSKSFFMNVENVETKPEKINDKEVVKLCRKRKGIV